MASTLVESTRVVAGHEIETCSSCPSCRASADIHRITEVRLGEAIFTSQVLCKSCGLVFRRDRFTMNALQDWYAGMAASQTVQDDWKKVTSSPLEERRQARYRRNLDWIEKERKGAGPGLVLDVACGPGTGLLPFKEKGWSVTGIDVFSSRIEYAARKHGLELIEGLFEEYNFDGQKFDVVIASHILEHVHQPILFMRKIHDLLTEGGVAYVEVPNMLVYVTLRSAIYMAHNNDFSSLSLNNLMRSAGFEVAAEYAPETKEGGVKHLGVVLKKVPEAGDPVSPPEDILPAIIERFLTDLDGADSFSRPISCIRYLAPDASAINRYCLPGWKADAIREFGGVKNGIAEVYIHSEESRAPSEVEASKAEQGVGSMLKRLLRSMPFLYHPLRKAYWRLRGWED